MVTLSSVIRQEFQKKPVSDKTATLTPLKFSHKLRLNKKIPLMLKNNCFAQKLMYESREFDKQLCSAATYSDS